MSNMKGVDSTIYGHTPNRSRIVKDHAYGQEMARKNSSQLSGDIFNESKTVLPPVNDHEYATGNTSGRKPTMFDQLPPLDSAVKKQVMPIEEDSNPQAEEAEDKTSFGGDGEDRAQAVAIAAQEYGVEINMQKPGSQPAGNNSSM